MDRIRKRIGWFILLFLVGVASIAIGNYWLFVDAYCPALQDFLLYLCVLVLTIIGLLFALITKNDSPVSILASALFVLVGSLMIASIAGGVLSQIPEVQAIFCHPDINEKAILAATLRKQGKLDGAEDISRSCLEDIDRTPTDILSKNACGEQLARVLFEKAGNSMKGFPKDWGASKQTHCVRLLAELDEASINAQNFGSDDLVQSIQERQQRAIEMCKLPPATLTPTSPPTKTPTPTLTPTPTPNITVDIIRNQKTEDQALTDIRILENGLSILGLEEKDFGIYANDKSIEDFELEERQADDPICLIAVVDDSGSISPGINQIRTAIDKLNDMRKPMDELGMVLFAGQGQVRIVQYPAKESLDFTTVKGEGKLTALWDGVLLGLDATESCEANNKYLLVLTDGQDNDSKHLEGDNPTRANKVAGLAAEKGVDICTVGVESSGILDSKSLQLAGYGCGYHPAVNFDALASLFQDIFGYVRDFYRFTFDSSYIPADNQVLIRVLKIVEVKIVFTDH